MTMDPLRTRSLVRAAIGGTFLVIVYCNAERIGQRDRKCQCITALAERGRYQNLAVTMTGEVGILLTTFV